MREFHPRRFQDPNSGRGDLQPDVFCREQDAGRAQRALQGRHGPLHHAQVCGAKEVPKGAKLTLSCVLQGPEGAPHGQGSGPSGRLCQGV